MNLNEAIGNSAEYAERKPLERVPIREKRPPIFAQTQKNVKHNILLLD